MLLKRWRLSKALQFINSNCTLMDVGYHKSMELLKKVENMICYEQSYCF